MTSFTFIEITPLLRFAEEKLAEHQGILTSIYNTPPDRRDDTQDFHEYKVSLYESIVKKLTAMKDEAMKKS